MVLLRRLSRSACALGLLGVFGLVGLLAVPGCNAIQEDKLREEEVDAICDYFVRCGYADDAKRCVELWNAAIEPDPDLERAVDNGTVKYDDKAAKECIDALGDAECGGGLFFFAAADDACGRVYQGTVDDGGACWIDAQCVSGRCNPNACPDACCEGICVAEPPNAALGQDCTGGQDCVDGTYCDFTAGTCAAYTAAGGACESDYECGELSCLGGTCQGNVAVGSPCIDFKCGHGALDCDIDTMTCEELRGEGGKCNPTASLCMLDLRCDATSNTCVVPGGIGSPCDLSFFSACAGGDGWCDYDLQTNTGTCVALKAAGAACTGDNECASRYCGDTDTCEVEPLCVP